MRFRTLTVGLLCSLLFFWSCASYQANKQAALLTLPYLGALVKINGDITYTSGANIGSPNWQQLPVQIQDLPFTKATYSKYTQAVLRAGKMGSVPYNDTLKYKPKYLRLELPDKIGLTALLNREENTAVRYYLEHDDAYKLVTHVDLALAEIEIPEFLQAEAIQLRKDDYGTIILVRINGNQEDIFYFSELPVFDIGYSSFCWGKDRYGRKIIENLTDRGQRCPKGTYLKPAKIKSDAAYSRFN